MSNTTTINKRSLGKFYLIEGILGISWIVYLIKFYSFYKEAYYYTDKRLSLFLQLLSFLHDNWAESFIYFIVSFLLMTVTLFFTYFLYLVDKKEQRHKRVGLYLIGVNLFCFLLLLFNIYGVVFFILFTLAASLVYIVFVLATVGSHKRYEEGEIIETKGPFETEMQARKEVAAFITKRQGKEKLVLGEEIYLDEDNKYYADIYVETIKK